MKKSRGQTLIEFAAVGILVLGLLIFGLFVFGDKVADFFAGSDPGRTYNNARTIKFENPENLLSNVTVTIDGIPINPPIESIIKAGFTGGSYIQTSGSAGRMAQLGNIMKEYTDVLTNKLMTTGVSGESALKNELIALKSKFSNGTDGFLDVYNDVGVEDFDKKLELLEMAIKIKNGDLISDVKSNIETYITNLPEGNRAEIIKTFINDLLSFGNYVDYYIDPSLYMKYLKQEKKPDSTRQDLALVNKLKSAALSGDTKSHISGLIKIYYNGGYSQASPAAYNGERLCSTFNGTMISDTECEIPVP